ncbi:hypothetical protein ACFQ60_45160 [Streptomyces zhihengii]
MDGAAVVLLHDGLRVARYAEPLNGGGSAVLDLARTDRADVTTAAAVVVSRTPDGTRYLLAPWIAEAGTRDLLRPADPTRRLATPGGLTPRLANPAAGGCAAWPVLSLRSSARIVEQHSFLLTDLGELTPVHLTHTPAPARAPARQPRRPPARPGSPPGRAPRAPSAVCGGRASARSTTGPTPGSRCRSGPAPPPGCAPGRTPGPARAMSPCGSSPRAPAPAHPAPRRPARATPPRAAASASTWSRAPSGVRRTAPGGSSPRAAGPPPASRWPAAVRTARRRRCGSPAPPR